MKIGKVVKGEGSPVGNPYETFPFKFVISSDGNKKWKSTKTQRYATDDIATIEAYLKEFNRFMKHNGAMTNIIIRVILKFLSSNSEFLVKTNRIKGRRSPTTIMYDIPTPKHLIAMAKSNMILKFGLIN